MKIIKTINRDNLNLNIQLMDTSNEEEINKFLISYYKSFGLRYTLDSNWFKWFYNQNPFGKCQNFILTDGNEEIVGGYGFSLFNYSFQEEIKSGVIGINGFINPDYTGLGLYTELISEGLKVISKNHELAFTFLHSNNIPTIKGHLKGNWQIVKQFYFYVKTVTTNTNAPLSESTSESLIEDLKNYQFSSGKGLFFIKDYEWLHWRFSQRPDKDYKVIISKLDGKIAGYFIYSLYKDKDGNTRCQIADYDYSQKDVFLELLDAITAIGLKNKYSTLEFLVNEQHFDTQILSDNSFFKKDESYEMLINGSLTRFNESRSFKFEYGYFDVI